MKREGGERKENLVIDIGLWQKKLIYRSQNRGCKEMDILLGCFAKNELMKLTQRELLVYEMILQCNDSDLYRIITYLNKKEYDQVQIQDKISALQDQKGFSSIQGSEITAIIKRIGQYAKSGFAL